MAEAEGTPAAAAAPAAAAVPAAAPAAAAPAAAPRAIHCWAGPRSLSTALMYSFAQRADVARVDDEPLYAHWLRLHPDAFRPPGYRERVAAAQDADGAAVAARLVGGGGLPLCGGMLYAKHMAKHRLGAADAALLRDPTARHFLLVRRPEAALASFAEAAEPTLVEACYASLLELASALRAATGAPPPIILAEDLAEAPEATLRALCSAIGIEFLQTMLHWPAGAKSYDGVWADVWYGGVHKSTNFGKGGAAAPFPPRLRPLLADCRPLYYALRHAALRPRLGAPPPPLALSAKAPGTHAHEPDPRNPDVLIGIHDGATGAFELAWRPEARVSVLDSCFLMGDGVWEGLRVRGGTLLFARQHLARLYAGAAALDLPLRAAFSPAALLELVYWTLDANSGMEEGVHVRLCVSRGLKSTPYQSPAVQIGGPTIVIIPEYKSADARVAASGVRLATVAVRRGPPDVQDPVSQLLP
jgi:hypothetical protein